MKEIIDSYHYCDKSRETKKKSKYYNNKNLSKIEKEKSLELRKKLEEFIRIVHGERAFDSFDRSLEGKIHYKENLGYIASVNPDYDIVNIYLYGKTVEEAFIEAVKSYELTILIDYELDHREELNQNYSNRFLDGKVSKDDYHGPFFFSELALQDFRKYYKNEIPKEIINYYENRLKEIDYGNFEYDYETNGFIKKQD